MDVWHHFDARAKRLGILDTKLAQAAAIFVALVIVKLIPQVMSLSVWWFVALAAAFALKPCMTFFGRDATEASVNS